MSMPERIIFDVINEVLDAYKANTDLLQIFFETELQLDTTEAAKIKSNFEDNPPKLIYGYARITANMPCWAIVLGQEVSAKEFLDEEAGALDSDGEYYRDSFGNIIDAKVRLVNYTINIMCAADHPDLTIYYYNLLKYIILTNHDELIKRGFDDIGVSGAELVPDPRYLPHDIFLRQVSITAMLAECWTSEIPGGFRNKIGGIHIDDTGLDETAGSGSTAAKVSVSS